MENLLLIVKISPLLLLSPPQDTNFEIQCFLQFKTEFAHNF